MAYTLRYDRALRGGRIETVDEAKVDALIAMHSRSALLRVEIISLESNVVGGIGPVVIIAYRSKRGGSIRWRTP